MDKIIYRSVKLPCDAARAFEMFTSSELLEKWLTAKAGVEPVVGGKYELFWNAAEREFDNTIGCRITALDAGKLLAFEWRGSKQYSAFMSDADPRGGTRAARPGFLSSGAYGKRGEITFDNIFKIVKNNT